MHSKRGLVGRRSALSLLSSLPLANVVGCAAPVSTGGPSKSAAASPQGADPTAASPGGSTAPTSAGAAGDQVIRTDEEWKQTLKPKQYAVCRMKGTEQPFTGDLWDEHRTGTYYCVACGAVLFESTAKFDSGTGWPSFFDVAKGARVKTVEDHSMDMDRIEVMCERCGAHLGHVFDDGPKPTGLRYCINSAALRFEAAI